MQSRLIYPGMKEKSHFLVVEADLIQMLQKNIWETDSSTLNKSCISAITLCKSLPWFSSQKHKYGLVTFYALRFQCLPLSFLGQCATIENGEICLEQWDLNFKILKSDFCYWTTLIIRFCTWSYSSAPALFIFLLPLSLPDPICWCRSQIRTHQKLLWEIKHVFGVWVCAGKQWGISQAGSFSPVKLLMAENAQGQKRETWS